MSVKIENVKVDMPREMQDFILSKIDQPLSAFSTDSQKTVHLEPIVTDLTNTLKAKYGGVWQVVILTGTYSAFSAYVPERLFHFKYGRFIILVWQSSSF